MAMATRGKKFADCEVKVLLSDTFYADQVEQLVCEFLRTLADDFVPDEISGTITMRKVVELISQETCNAVTEFMFREIPPQRIASSELFSLYRDVLEREGDCIENVAGWNALSARLQDELMATDIYKKEAEAQQRVEEEERRTEKAEETKAVTFLESRGYTVTKD